MKKTTAFYSLPRLSVALFAAVLFTGCPQDSTIWISSASKANRIVFGIGKKRGKPGGVAVGVVRIDRCAMKNYPQYDDALWVLSPTGRTLELTELVYGEAPTGFSVSHGPLPLTAGCYRASISGTGNLEFVVDASGNAHEKRASK